MLIQLRRQCTALPGMRPCTRLLPLSRAAAAKLGASASGRSNFALLSGASLATDSTSRLAWRASGIIRRDSELRRSRQRATACRPYSAALAGYWRAEDDYLTHTVVRQSVQDPTSARVERISYELGGCRDGESMQFMRQTCGRAPSGLRLRRFRHAVSFPMAAVADWSSRRL